MCSCVEDVCSVHTDRRHACVVHTGAWGCRDVCRRQCVVCIGVWRACDEEMKSPNLDPPGTLRTNDTELTPFVQRAGKSNKAFNFKKAQLGKFFINTA